MDSESFLRLPLTPQPISEDQQAVWAGKPTFDRCVSLASRYYARVVGAVPPPQGELARELAELVKQLDFLLKTAYVLHEQYWRLHAGKLIPDEYRLYRHTSFVQDLNASMFYYVGHRVQVILRDKRHELPHIYSYRQAVGTREVRNHVLEHPDFESFVTTSGLAAHSEYGPGVRPSRDGKPLNNQSRWLFLDATELEEAVGDVLARAHRSLDVEARADS